MIQLSETSPCGPTVVSESDFVGEQKRFLVYDQGHKVSHLRERERERERE